MSQKLLLHICCGPCAIHVWRQMQERFAVTGYFYNPNIQPAAEYEFRRLELVRLAEKLSWPVVYGTYDLHEWFAAVRGLEREQERGARCPVCFRFRLEHVFRYAGAHGFDAVTSTLSISPSKSIVQINEQGEALAKRYGVTFLSENFKKKDGFLIGRRLGEALGVHRQDYCGCVYSKVERIRRRRPPSP